MSRPLQIFHGGSFDPVHNGHLAIARAVRDALGGELALVPARDPPHKPPTAASAAQRVQMLELAIAGEPGLRVDRRELRRPGPSYTVDTLFELRSELGEEVAIAWLIGADSLLQLHTWYRWRRLFDLAHIVAVPRRGVAVDAADLRVCACFKPSGLPRRDDREAITQGTDSREPARACTGLTTENRMCEFARTLAAGAPAVLAEIAPRVRSPGALAATPAGGFCMLPLPALHEEASSALRQRIASDAPGWRDWVPPAVAAYIVQQGLYRPSAAILPPSPSSTCP